jgi:serine/threonine protein kinase
MNPLVSNEIALTRSGEQKTAEQTTGIMEYETLLNQYGFAYSATGSYWQVGEVDKVQGWLLHICVIEFEFTALLHTVLPLLKEHKVPFKIPVNYAIANSILSGYFGYHQLGKLITLYPETDNQAVELATILVSLTQDYQGPAIPTDVHLGGGVYTRYGGFKPLQVTTPDGNIQKFIYNQKGELIEDKYMVPFQLPQNISWPFTALASPKPPKSKKFLNKRYLPINYLKRDAKGDVIKALHFKHWRQIEWCIIKQGKQYMNMDMEGRDIRDRLKWQFQLHKKLEDIIPVPKAIDLFDKNGDCYFVMELVNGENIGDVITGIYQGRNWLCLPATDKVSLLDYLLQLIHDMEKLFDMGLVHRDLNSRNFLLTEERVIKLIDLELMYSFLDNEPNPPFVLGSPGYMSPEQWQMQPATIEQDIYGLGALMIKFFTSLSPIKFNTGYPELLEYALQFLIGDEQIVRLLLSCLSYIPDQRPSITQIKETIFTVKENTQGEQSLSLDNQVTFFENTVNKELINGAIASLSHAPLLSDQGLWHSKTIHADKQLSNELVDFSIYPGLHSGISGVLYLLAQARQAGFEVEHCRQAYEYNLQFLLTNYVALLPNVIPGYYTGAAGIGLALAAGVQAGWILPSEILQTQIMSSLGLPNNDINVATGIAGQGLAALYCSRMLEQLDIHDLVTQYADQLINQQAKDGSWLLKKVGVQEKGIKISGFSYGIAGIIYFLMEYADVYQNLATRRAAEKGLAYLMSKAVQINGRCTWNINDKNKMEDPWFDYGFSGIALTFLRAYELFHREDYKQLATAALRNHPLLITTPYLSISRGVAGLGELYLEAARILKEPEWQQRADWVASFLNHTYLLQASETVSWLTSLGTTTTADLMDGNAGIIHFLIRHAHPGHIGFPLFHA